MSRFYYTFGSSKQFPYRNGWVEVVADSLEEAHKKFRSWFPDVNHDILNCSDYYTEEQWSKASMSDGDGGYKCYEVIEQFKFKIAVQEILRKVVAVKADSLAEAECLVQTAYDKEKIVLCADDLVEDPVSGERCNIFEADWCGYEDISDIEVIENEED